MYLLTRPGLPRARIECCCVHHTRHFHIRQRGVQPRHGGHQGQRASGDDPSRSRQMSTNIVNSNLLMLPRPRPGRCRDSSRDVGDEQLNFLMYVLMERCVRPGSHPAPRAGLAHREAHLGHGGGRPRDPRARHQCSGRAHSSFLMSPTVHGLA